MADFILLRLDANLQPTQWLQVRPATKVTPGQAQVHSAEQKPQASLRQLPVVAISASPLLSLRHLNAPLKGLDKFRQAVGFALEDQLISDLDELSFALPQQMRAGLSPVAVINKTELADTLARCQEAGFHLQALIPEASLLDIGNVLLERGLSSYRFAEDVAGSLETDQLPNLLRIKQSQDGLLPLNFLHPAGMVLPNLPSHIQAKPLTSVLGFFAERLQTQPTLLSAISAKDNTAQNAIKLSWRTPVWRAAMIVIGLALTLIVARMGVQHWQLKSALAQQEREILDMFANLFPNQPMALDPLGRIQSALKAGDSSGSAQSGLRLLRQIAPVLASETKLTLLNASYRSQSLDLSFRSPDLTSLESARARIASLAGIQASMGSNIVDPDGRMLTGHIIIAPAASNSANNSVSIPGATP